MNIAATGMQTEQILLKNKQVSLTKEQKPDHAAEIKKLSSEFEAIFLELVLKSMRESIQKSGFMDGGNGEDIFRSMLDSEYAKSLANQRTTGLAESIERHLLGLMPDSAQKTTDQVQLGLKKYNESKR